MNRLKYLLLALLLTCSAAAQSVLQSTVPGDLLGWETDELDVVISLLEESDVRLEVYSPAFDPDDYRSALEGLPELGDERYDGGEGEVQSHFTLSRQGEVIFERSYGVAPHGTEVVFEGTLAPGEYHLSSSFEGLAKNSFVYTLESVPPANIYFEAGATLLFNIRGQEFQPVMTVHVTEGDTPADFYIYDGDGYSELRGRLETPSGFIELPESGDLEWSQVRLGQPGTYTFSFYQPEGAYQYSNTIGIRTDSRLRGTPDGLEFTRAAPVEVRIIDTDGNRIPGTYEVEQEGDIRIAHLTGLPDGYVQVDTRTEGGIIESGTSVRFGPAGGVAIFVAERLPEPPTLLTVTASLEYGHFTGPWPLEFTLNGETMVLPENGELTMEIDPALHVLRSLPVVGATVTDGFSLPITAGDHAHAHFVVRPIVDLDLTVDVPERYVGEQFVFTATATTEFGRLLPGTLTINLPAGLDPHGHTVLPHGRLGNGQPFVFTLPATGEQVGEYDVTADLADWGLTDRVHVRVIAPEPEPAPEPVPEPEPVVIPEPEPEPLPDFVMERRSTVHLDFQAGQVASCELPVIAAGESLTLGLGLKVTDSELFEPSVVLPSASHDDLGVYVQEVERDGDSADMTVLVRNYGAEPVQGDILVPLPLGSELAGNSCSSGSAVGEELIISHAVPEGGSYLPGSSLLDGAALAEPRQVEGTLLWRLPWQQRGTISYGVSHEAALGELTEPALTVVLGDREHQLAGDVTGADYDAAGTVQQGLIRYPAAGSAFEADKGVTLLVDSDEDVTVRLNGTVLASEATPTEDGLLAVAIPLEPGRNMVSVASGTASQSMIIHGAGAPAAIAFEPVRLVADGRNSLLVDVIVTDADGAAIGNGPVSIGANTQPAGGDADQDVSGWQVQLENGRGRIELAPAASPYSLELSAVYGELEANQDLRVLGTTSGLYQGMASIRAQLTGGFELSGVARGYVETPLGEGTLQAALDIAASQSGLDLERSLAQNPDPTDRFPLTGAGQEAQPSLRSSDGFAVIYTDAALSAGYLEAPATVPGVTGLPTLTGLHAAWEFAEGWTVEGYAALTSSGKRQVDITPDGTRRYSLGESVLRGSETVTLINGDDETQLVRNVDYVLDEYLGAITLVQPLWPRDADMNEQFLRVDYAPATAARDQVEGGVGVRYETDGLTAAIGAAVLDEGVNTGLSVDWNDGPFSVSAALSLTFADELSHRGTLDAGWAITEDGRLELGHTSGTRSNRTTLSYRHDLHLGDATVGLSVGAAYAWEAARLTALAGASYSQGAFGASLDHEQGLSSGARSTSTAGVSYRLNDNLTARATFELVWGNSLDGTIGLVQRVGRTELELSYQLPTASGGGNLARFGVRAPLSLTDNLTLDLHGGVSREFSDGEMETGGGLAFRYRNAGLVASLGAEVAHSSDSGFKVVFRGGASGQIGLDQNLSIDANYQVLPSVDGRLSLAYSLKRGPLNLLTYHRLVNRPAGAVLEGEIAPTLNFANRLQLRPGVAYRLLLDDPVGNAYQASLFAIGYVNPQAGDADLLFGLGLGGHALWQPGTDSVSYGLSAEVQARILPEVWFGVGYTFGGFEGITAESAGGLYVRLDLLTGGQF